jgi:hypothetical protein
MSEGRYVVLATSAKFGGELDKWLAYPLTHYSFEVGVRELDRLTNEITDAEEQGHCHPFVAYELIPVDPNLIGEWDERRKR